MAVATGWGFTLVVTENAKVCSFGRNYFGQIGSGTQYDSARFGSIRNGNNDLPGFDGEQVVMVAAGRNHSACVTEEGSLWTWGNSDNGRLGTVTSFGMDNSRLRPDRLGQELFGNSRARMVACGENFTMLLTTDGHIWNCGLGSRGQLGHGDHGSRSNLTRIDPLHFGRGKITMIAAGSDHSMAQVAGCGALYTWGENSLGQLGHSIDSDCVVTPVALHPMAFGGVQITSFDAGYEYCMVITMAGLVYATGRNVRGQLGLGHVTNSHTFQRVGGTNPFDFQRVGIVSCGVQHSLFITTDNALWGCGHGLYDENPLYTTTIPVTHLYPTRITMNTVNLAFKVVSAGWHHSAAITCSGDFYTWGNGVSYMEYARHADVPALYNFIGDVSTPKRMEPIAFSNLRLGRWHAMQSDHALAIMMNSNLRLASDSLLRNFDNDLLKMIIKYTEFKPRADTGNALRTLIGFGPL